LRKCYQPTGQKAIIATINERMIKMNNKIMDIHKNREACVYVRQSTPGQVLNCKESQRVQYRLVERARELGWRAGSIRIIDNDLGHTASGCVNRLGFQELLSAVCDGKIGAIFSVEASRLARNGREWHTLLELCGVMKTLLVDQEAIYDLSLSNDRLLLGLKGEMSVMELNLFRERSQAAIQEKARRGELFLMIQIGYIKTKENKLKKDPDKRIRKAVELVFKKFREHGSMRQVYKWFFEKKIQLPKALYCRGERSIEWKAPSSSTISRILDNPVYAGTYAYGRTKTEVRFENGHKRLKKKLRKEIKEWDVLILDHHEGYITWEEYLTNQDTIAHNTNMKRPVVKGSVREGEALLGGLLRCGHCSRKLLVKYQGRNGSLIRYLCAGNREKNGGKDCISFGGGRSDKAVSDSLLQVLAPIGIKASIKAIDKIEEKSGAIRSQRGLALEQAEYETQLAKRRFNAVDPENRLVASTLEKEWNDALVKVTELEKEIKDLAPQIQSISEKEKEEVKGLAHDLPQVWGHPCILPELKKRIIRTVIKEIVVYSEDQIIKLVIHWEGGDHTELEVLKNKTGETNWRTDIETKQIITELARIMPDQHIASFLNRIGKRTATGLTWNPLRLCSFRKNNQIPVYREGERQKRDEFTADEVSKELGI